MQRYTAANETELASCIAAGNPEPEASGPIIVEITLWNGRIVQGSYYKGVMQPHILDFHDVLLHDATLQALVKQLLAGGYSGSSFIAEYGESDSVARIIWEIVAKQ